MLSGLVSAISREVHAIDCGTLVSDLMAGNDQLDATLVSERLLSILGAGFAVLALGLAGRAALPQLGLRACV